VVPVSLQGAKASPSSLASRALVVRSSSKVEPDSKEDPGKPDLDKAEPARDREDKVSPSNSAGRVLVARRVNKAFLDNKASRSKAVRDPKACPVNKAGQGNSATEALLAVRKARA
jgi:hypothetical protein